MSLTYFNTMKVTFVAIGSEQLAIGLLSGILKRDGHEVSLAFNPSLFHDRSNLEFKNLGKIFDKTGDVYDTIRKEQPDVLLFSSLTATFISGCSRWQGMPKKYSRV